LSNLIEEMEKRYMMLKLSGTEPDFDYFAVNRDAVAVIPTPRIDGYLTNSTFSEIFDSD